MNSVEQCLIIDNNPARANLVQKTLKDHKISNNIKVTVNCGIALVYLREVREKLKNKKTLVIMNVHTPIMSGLELMDELKGTSYVKSEDLLFVALTDTLDESSKEACRIKGISNFISSDFSADNLTKFIKINPELQESAEFKTASELKTEAEQTTEAELKKEVVTGAPVKSKKKNRMKK